VKIKQLSIIYFFYYVYFNLVGQPTKMSDRMSTQEKRKRLIDAAYKVFIKKGYVNASIKDIANEADMTSGLVHYYFKNKEELLLSVQDEVQKHYQGHYDRQPEDCVTPEEVLLEIKSRSVPEYRPMKAFFM